MKYSSGFKENILKKVLNQEKTVSEIHTETGISVKTIYSWIYRSKEGKLKNRSDELRVSSRPFNEKLTLLLEGCLLSDEDLGFFLRSQGLQEEHLTQWKEELMNSLSQRENQLKELKTENKTYKERNQQLEKELRRKEKALAETAALLTLKKKAFEIWGEREEE